MSFWYEKSHDVSVGDDFMSWKLTKYANKIKNKSGPLSWNDEKWC